MKKLDGAERSHRYSKTPSTTKHKRDHVFTPNDALVLYFLQIHYKVSANFLRMFVGAKSHNRLVARLKQAFRSHWGYIEVCPEQERSSTNKNYQPLTYQLTKKGREKLKDLGMFEEYTSRLSNWASHQLYTALFTASVHLWCIRMGYEFIPHQTIFKDPRATRKIMSLETSHGRVEPDQLFGIRFKDRVRFYALELDRATEQNSIIHEKVRRYDEVFARQTYKQWGIPNLTVLVYTRSKRHCENLLKNIHHNYYAFQWNPNIEEPWHLPSEPWNVMETPWLTCDGEYNICG